MADMLGNRRRIAINQGPGGGTVYPFLLPSAEIQNLLGDFYLSYSDPLGQFVLPFKIGWLYGFGPSGGSPPIHAFTPVNDREIVILDAEDQVVFSSEDTVVDGYKRQDWASIRDIVQWISGDAVCRLVAFTDTDPEYPPDVHDQHIAPDDGRLDPRTCERRLPRVDSLRVGLVTMGPDEVVVLHGGYNVRLTATAATPVDGQRTVQRVVIDASPGLGRGRYPGCEDADTVVRLINGQGPDDRGNLQVDATGCYQVLQPGSRAETSPGDGVGHEVTLTPNTLQVLDGCQPCCTCDDIINTYRGLTGIWELYRDLGIGAEAIRDQYAANVARWEDEQACRAASPFRLVLAPFCSNFLGVAMRFCNMTDSCRYDIELRVTFGVLTGLTESADATHIELNPGASPTPDAYKDMYVEIIRGVGAGQIRRISGYNGTTKVATIVPAWDTEPDEDPPPGETVSVYFIRLAPEDMGKVGCDSVTRRTHLGNEVYSLGGDWPQLSAFFDAVDGMQQVSAQFRADFDEVPPSGPGIVVRLQAFEGYDPLTQIALAEMFRWTSLISSETGDCDCPPP